MLQILLETVLRNIVAVFVAVEASRSVLVSGSIDRPFPSDTTLDASAICNKIPGLTPKQRLICRTQPEVMVAIGKGIQRGAHECRIQFRNLRWNCTGVHSNQAMLGFAELKGSKESAFYYAISSAGATYAITQACNLGSLSSCICDRRKRKGNRISDAWRREGCSTSIRYGVKMARKFMDAGEIAKNAISLMNLHNNGAGRKSVKNQAQLDCKCHGVSGSCSVKTCWASLPAFRHIGDSLRVEYMKAKLVVPYLGSRLLTPVSLLLYQSKRPHRKPRRKNLVYLEKSPNFCDYDQKAGILGTAGRLCNKTLLGNEGCDHLCCGRGYSTHQIMRVYQCSCKFHWCCRVECAVCTEKTERYTCN